MKTIESVNKLEDFKEKRVESDIVTTKLLSSEIEVAVGLTSANITFYIDGVAELIPSELIKYLNTSIQNNIALLLEEAQTLMQYEETALATEAKSTVEALYIELGGVIN